jgi:hypothetical protein
VTPATDGATRQSKDMTGPHHEFRSVSLVRGPVPNDLEQANQMGKSGRGVPDQADQTDGSARPDHADEVIGSVNIAAVAAYRASAAEGKPLSERKLAEAFGMTSRRWARQRMADARQTALPA